MVKRIYTLTEKQKAMMPVWAEKWIKISLKTGKTDWETFDKYMPICYEKANLKYPKNVVRVQSPMVGAFASSIAEEILSKRRKGGAVSGAVSGAVRGAVEDAVRGAVSDAVEDAVSGAVRGAVEDAVSGAVEDAVRGAVSGAVEDAVSGAVRGAKPKREWHFWLGGQFWVGWWGISYYVSFFLDVCKLDVSKDIRERVEAYRKVNESVNYIWANRDFVMVCARPKKIKRNSLGQLHNINGKAIEYPDGWGLYCLNGVTYKNIKDDSQWKKEILKKVAEEL